MTDLSADLALAIKAARAAGEALAARGADFQGVDSAEGHDIKLKADKAAEALILEHLAQGSAHSVLAEEGGWSGTPGRYAWIVDPLDGSSNYERRIPLCAVSIALVDGSRPVLGVIHDFNAGDLYSGTVDAGATLNGEPMRVSDVSDMRQATLMTGLPARRDYSPEALASSAREFARWKKVRMIGTAALAVAYVAAGRAERYTEDGAMLWDVAGGLALVEAAGGRVVMPNGPLDAPMTVLADNGRLNA